MNNPGMSRREFHIRITPRDAGRRPAQLLAEASGLSQAAVKDAMHKGAGWLTRGAHTRRLRRQKTLLREGDELHLYHDPQVLAQQAPQAQLLVDEGDYSVWVKPAGMRSQGSKWGDHTTLTRWCELHLEPQRPAFLVHRLDRAASGLMLVAHGKSMARQLAALFEQRQVAKRYRVLVEGKFPLRPLERVFDTPLDEKPSRSSAQRLAFDAASGRSLLEVQIETGRKHQIRRHLACAGFPVVGDRLYGGKAWDEDLRLAAVSLSFMQPGSGEPKTYELPPQSLAWGDWPA